jgi:hypothetical protein
MDPDAALTTARDALDVIEGNEGAQTAETLDLAEAFRALDEWLSRGGFAPADWRTDA